MDKIQLLAQYLNVNYTDLIHEKTDDPQDFFERTDIKVLFSLVKECTPDQIQATITLLEQFKKSNKNK